MSIPFSKMALCAPLAILFAGGLAHAESNSMDAATPPSDFRLGAGFNTAVLVPQGYEEGYLPKLSDIDIKEISQFARNSYQDLKDLLETATTISDYWEKARVLKRGVDEIIQKSKPLKTELLMRNVLERAIIMVKLIEAEVGADLRRKGVIDQEVRLLRESIKTSMRYWEPYLNHVNGQTLQANVDLAKINYRDFGINYSALLWSIANSIFDASAEYKLRMEALKLLMWDLYRDENKLELNQAGAIAKLYNFVKFAPDTATWTDDQYVENTKRVRIARNEAISRLNTPTPAVQGASVQVISTPEASRSSAVPAAVTAPVSGFVLGETVMVKVPQGRTVGRIARLDNDGFAIVRPANAGFSNYEGPVSGIFKYEELTQHDGYRLGDVVAHTSGGTRHLGRVAKLFRMGTSNPEVTLAFADASVNYTGALTNLSKTNDRITEGQVVIDRSAGHVGKVGRALPEGLVEVLFDGQSSVQKRGYPDQLARKVECVPGGYCTGVAVTDTRDGSTGQIEVLFENGAAGVRYSVDTSRLYWRTAGVSIRLR